MTAKEAIALYHQRQQETSQRAIERATDIVQRATGKPRSYYTTRSRKVEFVAYTTWEPLAQLRTKVINLSNPTKRNGKHRRNTTARTR